MLSTKLRTNSESLQLAYTRSHSSDAVKSSVEALAVRCGAHMDYLSLDDVPYHAWESSSKRVIYMTALSISDDGPWRKESMAAQGVSRHTRRLCVSHRLSFLEDTLSSAIRDLETAFPKHIFIYTGTSLSSLYRRQSPVSDAFPSPFVFAPNGTDTSGGIFHRFQLLTPGLIITLLVSFFLILPIIGLSVRALASIQSPLRMDAPKGSSQDKKNQ